MKRPVRLVLSVLSGVMLSLPWLGFPGWLLFAALLPLLALDDFFIREKQNYGSVSFWGHAFLSFLVWNGLTTWWILHATPAGAFVAIFLNSFLMSMVFWLAHLARRNAGGGTGYLAYPLFWIAFEYAHFHWDIEWPWLTLGNGFAGNVELIQWYEYTGVLGGTLWVWLVSLLLFVVLKSLAGGESNRRMRANSLLLILLLVIPFGWSLVRYHHFEEQGEVRKVLLVQPNIDPYTESHEEGAVNDKLMKFMRITRTHVTPGLDYIVGPETVFEQQWDESRLLNYQAFRQLQELTTLGDSSALIIGASTFRIYGENDQVPVTARRSADGLVYDVYNSAIYTDASGGYQVYHKSILVAGVEKMPFRRYLGFLNRYIINLGGTTGSLGIQAEPANFAGPGGDRIAPAICYESVFGGYLTEFVKKGAGAVFVITNDGWWKNTPGYRQHFSFARLRAVETRRCIARSANTGISGFISQRGEVLQQSAWWTEDALTGEIRFSDKMTFYVKNGDYIARIAVFASLLLLLHLAVNRLTRDKKNPH